ncbi:MULTISPECIES: hypothetical protein [Microbulbifer]|uniref:DUF350 domain-containing protein n=1 Tax=Microbulbifer celer TaxID=435905 RepID=A0ABW3UFH6_9GAMM|nr:MULTISPECIES: hypothetical protein [Microbulbifer]UFN58131.1 hypothetical protein LPW13_03515 [Microbulbifer celer]
MHEIHLAILILGTLMAGGLTALYYWSTDNLSHGTWLSSTGLALVLGYSAVAALGISYLLFAIIIGSYVVYFVYLKDYQQFTPTTESSMASLVCGSVIGISGLIGCILCA